MATRYWVGGSGSWSSTLTTNWSASSGGASGASAPTSADDVVFNVLSNTGTGAFTVTVSTSAVCLSFTASGLDGVMTLGGTSVLSIYGSLTLPATNFLWTNAATTLFRSTTTGRTVTTNGVNIAGGFDFSGVGGGWTLGSALTLSEDVIVTAGSFNTGNFNVTIGRLFSATGTLTRAVTLGSSTITVADSGSATSESWDITVTTGLTFSAGTSTIIMSGASPNFTSAALTYRNVSFTSTASSNTVYLYTSGCTFTTLTFTAPSVASYRTIELSGNNTITTLVASGASAVQRLFFTSSVFGTNRSLTVGTWTTKTDVDFQSITALGTSIPWSGTRLGDGGDNNANITFTSKTVYWNLAGTMNWPDTGWATTSGGVPAVNNFPLPQDTAVFDNAGAVTSITLGDWLIGTLDMSGRTSPMVLTPGTGNPFMCGDITLGTGVTTSSNNTIFLQGFTLRTLTTNGVAITFPIEVFTPWQLGSALTSTSILSVNDALASFDAVSYPVTVVSFRTSVTNTDVLMGSGLWTLTASVGVIWQIDATTTFTKGTANILESGIDGGTKEFRGGGKTYNNFTLANTSSTGTILFTGANTFATFASLKTGAHTLTFPASTINSFSDFSVNARPPGVVLTINSSTPGTKGTVTKIGTSTITVDYASITDSTGSPANKWFASNTLNNGTTAGWTYTGFTAPASFLALF